jgi:hypothetical protein
VTEDDADDVYKTHRHPKLLKQEVYRQCTFLRLCSMTVSGFQKTSSVHIMQLRVAVVQPMLHWKSSKYYIFWVRVCRLRYPAWNVHASYRYLWPSRLYSIFSSHKRHYFRKTIIEHKMCVFIFSTRFVLNISYSKKNLTRYDKKMVIGLYIKYLWSLSVLIRLEFSRQIFEKYSNINFYENHSPGSRDVRCWRQTWLS